jgi:hypothetical protein
VTAKAKYSLEEVCRLVDEKRVYFSAKSRSTSIVLKVYEKSGFIKTQAESEMFILQGIKCLTPECFYQRVLQWDDPKCVADVYGLILDGKPWYVKFLIEDGELQQISFYPPEKEFVTISGIRIPKGEWGNEK